MEDVKKCVLLCRVSTMGQELDPQISDLKKFAKEKGFGQYKIIETKESGLINFKNREGTNTLFEFLKTNPDYNTVICTEMSRLGRTEADLHIIKDWFIKNKIQFFLKDRQYQLFDDKYRLNDSAAFSFTFYGYIAESEMRTKKERFKRAKIYWNGMGVSLSGKLLFGYKKVPYDNKRNTYAIDENQAEEIQKIFHWYAYGIDISCPNPSIKDIVLHCIKKGFSNYTHIKRNVNKLLKEEAYLGFKTTNNKRKNPYFTTDGDEPKYITTNTEIKYPIILNRALFEAVQAKLKTNNTRAEKSTKHTTILSKLIECPGCHRFLGGDYVNKKAEGLRYGYRCLATRNIIKCSYTKHFSMQMLDSTIWSTIKSDLYLLSKEIFENNPDNILKTLKEEEENLKKRQWTLEEKFKMELISYEKIRSMRNFNVEEHLKKFKLNIDRLDAEKRIVDQELNSITVKRKMLEEEKIHNYEEIIKNNIEKIENDKALLKYYTSLYISGIKILYQGVKHTILEITFKKVSTDFNRSWRHAAKHLGDLPLEKKIYLLIDKTITLNIQIRKITRMFTIENGNIIMSQNTFGIKKNVSFSFEEITVPNEKTQEKLNDLLIGPYERSFQELFTPIEYTKLDLYPKR